jgi:4-diphosphocytidyl-2-C-methyl-D-erythritol kinase
MIPTDERNLVFKAWRLLGRRLGPSVGGVGIRLGKRIPAGAGLGGGSSDAAATLIGLNRLFGLALAPDELQQLGAELGADVPFFIRGGTVRATGRGEILQALDPACRRLRVLVVWPGFASPTEAAYKLLRVRERSPISFSSNPSSIAELVHALRRGDVDQVRSLLINDFDARLTALDARYRNIKAQMMKSGLARPMLSGSGSACFAIAKDERQARSAARELARVFPLVKVVKPRRRGVSLAVTSVRRGGSAGIRRR